MARRIGIRPHQQPDVVRDERVGRPDLLARDDVVVTIGHRPSLQRREIRPSVGLGEALAPDFFRREHRPQIACLLLLAGDGNQRRTRDHQTDVVDTRRNLGPSRLLVEDRLLPEGQSLATVLGGPRQAQPAGLVELLLPGLEAGHVVLRYGWSVLGKPVPKAVSERGLFRRVLKSGHGNPHCSYRARRVEADAKIDRCGRT